MLTPSSGTLAEYNAAILNCNPTHARVVFPVQNITLTDDDISANGGISITDVLNADTDLTVGKAVSKEAVIYILNSDKLTDFDWTEEFHIDFGVDINDETNWVTVGYFTGKKPDKIVLQDVIQFTAYDRMNSQMNVIADSFVDGLTFPCTMGDIYESIGTETGITIATGDEIQDVMDVEYAENPFLYDGITYRDILAWISEANGCYARITADGEIQMRWYEDRMTDYSLNPDKYFEINVSEIKWISQGSPLVWNDIKDLTWNEIKNLFWNEMNGEKPGFAISAVWLKNEEVGIDQIHPSGYTDSTGIYRITGNPLMVSDTSSVVDDMVEDVYDRLTGIGGYVPLTVRAIGNWMVETGDIIEVVYGHGNRVRVPIFTRTLEWNGGCQDVYECTSTLVRELTSAESSRLQYESRFSKKYSVKSGIDIETEGVTISGGKFLKLISGGVLDVDATNFKIDSENKTVKTGKWTITTSGMSRKDSEEIDGQTVDESFNIGFKILPTSGYTPTGTECKTSFNYYTLGAEASGNDIIYNSYMFLATENPFTGLYQQIQLGFTENSSGYDFVMCGDGISGNRFLIGSSNTPIDYGYFAKLGGSAVVNNLTTTAAGYVLDARQGANFYKVNMNGTNRQIIIKSASLGSVAHSTTQSSEQFSTAFPSACLAVWCYCTQAGFGAPSTIAVGSITKTGFKYTQVNTQSASMSMAYVAIGY